MNRPQLSFLLLSFWFFFFMFVTAVNAELFLFTLWHSVIVKNKIFLFPFYDVNSLFPVVSTGPVCEKGRRRSQTPTWPLVRVVILDHLLTELREWSDVPRKTVQQPQVGSCSPAQTQTETSGQYNSITTMVKVAEILSFYGATKKITNLMVDEKGLSNASNFIL